MPPCGGAPNFSASSRKPNRSRACSALHAEHLEQPRLHLRVVDTDAAAADLVAVDDQVVRLGLHLARVGFQQRQVLVPRGRERMVVGRPALLLLVPDERREVDDPGES